MQFAKTNVAGFHWISNPNDKYIGKSLQTYGEWSYGEIEFLSRYLDPASRVIEVGANIGAHTVPLAKIVHKGRVIAFEPQRISFQLLCANLAGNNCINVSAYNLAVGDAAGSTRMPDADPRMALNFGGIGVNPDAISNEVQIKHGMTPIVRLDDMIGEDFKPSLIKCDAEGMEVHVLEGARTLIARDKPVLYLEDDRPPLSQSLFETVRGYGYDVWWHPVPLFRANNLAGAPENIFPNIYSLSVLCCHPDKPVDTGGLQKIDSLNDHPMLKREAKT